MTAGYVFKRKQSPFYIARFMIGGNDHRVSTGCRNEKQARAELKRLIAEAQGRLDLDDQVNVLLRCIETLPSDDQPQKRQEIVRLILAGQDRKLAIADGWQAWKEHPNKKQDPKESTLAGYEAAWNRFKRWAESKKLIFLHEVTRERAEDYAADLWKSRVTPSTYGQHIKFLKSAFGVLESKAGLVSNPWAQIHSKQKRKDVDESRRNLTEEELRTILIRSQGDMRVMFAIGLFTGLRLGDVACLKWENIDNDPFKREKRPGFIVVQPIKTSRTGKKVELPIHAALRSVLDEHRRSNGGSEFLFPHERLGYLDNTSNLTNRIQAFFESCGLRTTEKAEQGQRRRAIVKVGFHSLRHSFVSLCAKAGVQQHVVQKLVGHGSPAMTAHYTHLDAEQKKEAIAALPMTIPAISPPQPSDRPSPGEGKSRP